MIIFFYGENDFKIKQKIQEGRDKFMAEIDPAGQNIFVLDGEKMSGGDLAAHLNSPSLFSRKKMVIISNLINNKQKEIFSALADYLRQNQLEQSDDILIFSEKNIKSKNQRDLLKISSGREASLTAEEKKLYSYLRQQKYQQECKNFTSAELSRLVNSELAGHNLKIEARDIQLLLALVGSDPWKLHQEIKKLAHYKTAKGQADKIQKNDLEKMIGETFNDNIFSFIDALSSRNIKLALRLLEEQYLAGSEPEYIAVRLLKQFKILLSIRELLDLNYNSQKIISSLKLHPFVVAKGINQAKNFDQKTLKSIINSLMELERLNRSASIDLKVFLNLMINRL